MNRPSARNFGFLGLAACLALAATSAGCDLGIPKVYVEETQIIELSAMDIETLSALTHNGHVKVEAAADGGETIIAEVTIRAGGRTEEEAEQALRSIEILTPVTGDDENVQEIRTRQTERRPFRSVTVSYDITMPATLALRAKTHNGKIEVREIQGACELESHNGRIEVDGASGSLSAKTHNGGIDVATEAAEVNLSTHNGGIEARLFTSGQLSGKIDSHNGSIRLSFQQGVSADVDCRTRNGHVSINDTALTDVWQKRGRKKHIKGRLGEGGSELKVETSNGSISLEIDD